MQLFAESAYQKGLELVYQLDEDVPIALQGDPWRLRQILDKPRWQCQSSSPNAEKFSST